MDDLQGRRKEKYFKKDSLMLKESFIDGGLPLVVLNSCDLKIMDSCM